MSDENGRYIVRSGTGYVCQDNGDDFPIMSSHLGEALCHTLDQAARRLDSMDGFGLIAVIEKECKASCIKCDRLKELYERTPKEPRDYWLMTELFVLLHGSDVCKESDEREPMIQPD